MQASQRLRSGGPWIVLVLATAMWVAGSAGAAGSCTSPAGADACTTAASAPYVTPDQAKAAVSALWNAREAAYLKRDAVALGQLETGSQRLESQYALNGLVCKCWTWYWTKGARTIRNLTVFLPREQQYPLSFLAYVAAGTPGQAVSPSSITAAFVVTRRSPADPWRIEMQLWDSGYSNGEVPGLLPPSLDQDGYDTAVPQDKAGGAAGWPGMLAAYYRSLKTTGAPTPGSPFLAGPLTTGTDLAVRRQGYVHDGTVSHYAFSVGGSGAPWLFVDADGRVESCADILETQTLAPQKKKTVFVQKAGPGQAWGPDLNTGYYSKVVTTFEWPSCVREEKNGLSVVGPGGSVPIHTGGVPAKLTPGMLGLA